MSLPPRSMLLHGNRRSHHASTLVETGDGHVLCAWFAGSKEGSRDTEIQIARIWGDGPDYGRAVTLDDGLMMDCSPPEALPCWNPVLWREPNGTLYCFYKIGESPRSWRGYYKLSADGGNNWSPRCRHVLLSDGVGPTRAKGIQLGTHAVFGSGNEMRGGKTTVVMLLWRNLHEAWKLIEVEDPTGLNPIQPALLKTKTGLMALCRTRQGFLARTDAIHLDCWTPLRETNIPNPSAGIDTLSLGDGKHLLIYNPTDRSDRKRRRHRLDIAFSSDDGETWRTAKTLADRPGREFSYPAMIQLSNGNIAVSYTHDREAIAYRELDLDSLLPF